MDEQQEKKISLPEGVLLIIVCLVIDLIGTIIEIFVATDFDISEIVGSAIIDGYLYIKKVPLTRAVICEVIDVIAGAIPWAGELFPGLTVGFAITWWADAHPESAAAKALETAAKIKGGKGAAAGSVASKAESQAQSSLKKRIKESAEETRDRIRERIKGPRVVPSGTQGAEENVVDLRPQTQDLPPFPKETGQEIDFGPQQTI